MSQVKLFGLRDQLYPIRQPLSDLVHQCIVEILQLPVDKRAHRFFYFDEGDFLTPDTASERYIILELLMLEGRTTETKKKLIHLLFERLTSELSLKPTDIEICILDNPACNWGFRGMTGDELKLPYTVRV